LSIPVNYPILYDIIITPNNKSKLPSSLSGSLVGTKSPNPIVAKDVKIK
jgi:hypothetical protein